MVELLNRISFLCNILGTCHLLEVAGGLVQMGGGEGHFRDLSFIRGDWRVGANGGRGGSLNFM